MKYWLSFFYHSICFFLVVVAMYRLGMSIPPAPEDEGYLGYCIGLGLGAVLIAGSIVVVPMAYTLKEYREYRRENNRKKHRKAGIAQGKNT